MTDPQTDQAPDNLPWDQARGMLRIWQDRILTTIMALSVILGLPAVVVVAGYLLEKGLVNQLILNFTGLVTAVLALFFRRRLPYFIKAGLTLIFFFAIGLGVLWRLGPWSGGLIWLTGFGVMAGLLFGMSGSAIALVTNTLALLVVGWFIDHNPPLWAVGQEAALKTWLIVGTNFVLINALVTGSTALMMRGLTQTARREREVNRDLQNQMEERRLAQKALRSSENRYRALFEQANDAIIITNRSDRIIDVNSKACIVYGYPREEFLTLTIPDLQAPEYRGTRGQVIERELGHQGRVFEVVDLKKDGARIPLEITTTPLEGAGQGLVLCIVRDITRRKEDEAALLKSEQAYRLLFDSIADIIYTHDLEGKFLSVNPATYQVMGIKPEAVKGQPMDAFLAAGDQPRFKKIYLPAIKSRGRYNDVGKFITPGGELRYIEYNSSLVTDSDGSAFVHGVGRDVTERVKTRREVDELQARLNQAHKMEAVGTLASGIAHDFNNLLQAIIGNSQLLLSLLAGNSEASDRLTEIDNAAGRAAQLIRRLTTFSRRISSDLKSLDLNAVVKETVGLLKRTIPKMIDIRLELAREGVRIKGDAVQLEQVIMNLATNARDAMPEGGLLTLSTAVVELDEAYCRTRPGLTPGSYARLVASDTGQGMDKKTREHLFEPFYTTKEAGRGTGLGLSTVYGVIKSHGGRISALSRPGRGSSFEIHLPLQDRATEVPAEPKKSLPVPSGGGETILVIDDEAAIREVARQALQGAGFLVQTAASGEDGLLRFQAGGIDLVLLDLGMPGMGGRRCLEELLILDPRAKVIIASGYLSGEGLKEIPFGQNARMIDKPYRLADLISTVKKVLAED